MRYSDELIDEVRSRNDIVDVIGGYLHLEKKGGNYFGLCPFHNEKSPSFSVSGSKQIFHCFGCGKGGNVFTFVMEYENESFTEAMKRLAERAGMTLPEAGPESAEEKRRRDEKALLLDIQKTAATYFYYQLKSESGKRAYQYLTGRGLSDATIKSFGLGYSLPYSNDLYRYLREKGYHDDVLKKSGLVKIEERGAHDSFWNRVMFPIMDANNHVIGFGGRVMGDGEPKYLNSPETPIFDKSRTLFGLNVARKTRKSYFLICEGYMDVISLHQAGFTNAVAALGTAFTPAHASIIRRYVKDVCLTFDSDGAGIKAALRAIPILKEAGINARVVSMKPHKDPDEFIKALGAEEYQKRIDQAKNSFLFEIGVLREQFDFSDPSQKTDFFDETARKLTAFQDPIERNNYVEAVARDYGMDYRLLKEKVEHLPRNASAQHETAGREQTARRRKEADSGLLGAERLVLNMLSDNPASRKFVLSHLGPDDFSHPVYREVASMLFDQVIKGSPNPAVIIDRFVEDEEKSREAARIFNAELSGETDAQEKERALRSSVFRILRESLNRQLSACEEKGDMDQFEVLMARLSDLEQKEKGK